MTKFDPSYEPPAPTTKIILRNIATGERLRNIDMLLDTGADITLLPKSYIETLEIKPSENQKYELTGFDGSIVLAEIFYLQIIFLGKRFTGNYCVVDSRTGVLGRDILNQISLLFDGPNLEWDEIRPT